MSARGCAAWILLHRKLIATNPDQRE